MIFFFALLYVLPHYYWEYFCGGTLAGYLAHLKNLILAIEQKCKTVPKVGIYGGKEIKAAAIFDENSDTFSTSRKYKRYWYGKNFVTGGSERPPIENKQNVYSALSKMLVSDESEKLLRKVSK